MSNLVIRSTPDTLAKAFRRVRERTSLIFSLARPEAYYERPIALRHPIAFYDGHVDAFNWVTLCRHMPGVEPFDPDLDALFQRGIDPADTQAASQHDVERWPSREAIRAYKREVSDRFFRALERVDLERAPGLLRGGYLFQLLLEHELMHQETLLYILHQLPYHLKVRPRDLMDPDDGLAPVPRMVDVQAGKAVLGSNPDELAFAWDNELPRHEIDVAAFRVDACPVTNAQFLEFMEAAGYRRREFWDDETWAWREEQGVEHPHFWRREGADWHLRGMFADHPLPLSHPVMVTHAEAEAYARFAGKHLPTEAEWHRAAYGDAQDRRYPWGSEPATLSHGNFEFSHWGTTPVGRHRAGSTPEGVHDLLGNGWEWTSTPFGPFPGFAPSPGYPQYSADFFDGAHYVMKGGSCFTDRKLLRRSFRNWFYWHYPYMYGTFRCVER